MTPTVFMGAMPWVTCSQANMFFVALSSKGVPSLVWAAGTGPSGGGVAGQAAVAGCAVAAGAA
ncbi:hypothetical protein, partial [Streptomyces sp. NPDC002491]